MHLSIWLIVFHHSFFYPCHSLFLGEVRLNPTSNESSDVLALYRERDVITQPFDNSMFTSWLAREESVQDVYVSCTYLAWNFILHLQSFVLKISNISKYTYSFDNYSFMISVIDLKLDICNIRKTDDCMQINQHLNIYTFWIEGLVSVNDINVCVPTNVW